MRSFASADSIRRQLEAIAVDRRRGASELTRRTIALFGRCRPRADATAAAYRADVGRLVRRAQTVRPLMVSIGAAARSVGRAFDRAAASARETRDAYRALRQCADRIGREFDARLPAVAAHYRRAFGHLHRIATISWSAQVIHALGAPGARSRRVTVCESRPALEGRRTARALADRVRSVTLITEAQMAIEVPRCEVVVFGCDAILPGGAVVNKTGSLLLARVARDAAMPVVVLGDRFKLAAGEQRHQEQHAADDVWRGAPRGVQVRNVPFEVVPPTWITAIVLEDGVYDPHGIPQADA